MLVMLARKPSPAGDASGPLVRYDRAALLTGALLIAIAAISWVALVRQGNMGSMDAQPSMNGAMPGGMDQGMGVSALLSPPGAAAYLAAWGVMMAAMMLPSATPLISLYAGIQRRSPPEQRGIPAVLFAVVYLLMWLLAGVPVYAASVAIAAATDASSALARLLPYGVALALLAAGIYQFTPLKSRCLTSCQSPLGFLMGHWRPGAMGTLRMAFEHSLYCLGCCAGLMVVLVAAGAMSLPWALLIAAVVFAEKVLPAGAWTARAAGAALVLLGVLVVAEPGLAATLRAWSL
jgi:predicted metal-binding membrane protein